MGRPGRRRFAMFGALLIASALAGPAYVSIRFPGSERALVHSAIAGFVGGIAVWGTLLFLWPSRRLAPLRRSAFPVRLLTLCSGLGLVTALGIYGVTFGTTGRGRFTVDSWSVYAYVLGVGLVLVIGMQVIRMIGPQALTHILLGRYHKPKERRRVFLFIDLADSTAHARHLGDLGVQELISQFVFDLSGPILEHGGEIHAYVGDGVIVTWPYDRGVRRGTCIASFFAVRRRLEENADLYRARFGAAPRIRGGLHGGTVVVSEIGLVPTAVVYSGDTVNTAARLEDAAKRHDRHLVTSRSLLDDSEVPAGLRATSLGEEVLRGHDAPTELVAIGPIDEAPSPEVDASRRTPR